MTFKALCMRTRIMLPGVFEALGIMTVETAGVIFIIGYKSMYPFYLHFMTFGAQLAIGGLFVKIFFLIRHIRVAICADAGGPGCDGKILFFRGKRYDVRRSKK